jgi:ATP/maltotriose-dependent transcriptional regulator MalT
VAHREAGDDTGATVPLALLGLAAGEQGDTARAAALMQQGLEASSHLLDRRLLLMASEFVVWWLAEEQGDPEQLAVLLGAAEAMGDRIGPIQAGWRKTRTPKAMAALQARLGREPLEAALRKGRALSFSQISEQASLVLKGVGGDGSSTEESSVKGRQPVLLSSREEQVLARQLTVSQNTVKTHVTSLFNKLGVDSRAHAVAVAANVGLLDGITT